MNYGSTRSSEIRRGHASGHPQGACLFQVAVIRSCSESYLRCVPGPVMELENAATKGVAEAKGLFRKVTNVTFVLFTAFLRDILDVVNKLSQTFQKNDLDISTVNIMIDHKQT